MALVVLFDIDGTLVTTGGAGRRSLRRAFGEVVDAPHALDGLRFGGRTDPWILRTALAQIDRAWDDALVARITEAYLRALEDEVARSEGYRVMPHVRETIASLAREDVAIGLGTGNMEPGARIKLARADLSAPFAFGGFGSDAEDRAELLRAGAERGAKLLGVPLDEARVVIVGDTVHDVRAAAAIGARSIAVATGGVSLDDLRSAGAHHALPDLREGALDAILG